MTACDFAPCPWCGDLTDEGAEHHACMVAHCLPCLAICHACQNDLKTEGDQ